LKEFTNDGEALVVRNLLTASMLHGVM